MNPNGQDDLLALQHHQPRQEGQERAQCRCGVEVCEDLWCFVKTEKTYTKWLSPFHATQRGHDESTEYGKIDRDDKGRGSSNNAQLKVTDDKPSTSVAGNRVVDKADTLKRHSGDRPGGEKDHVSSAKRKHGNNNRDEDENPPKRSSS